MIQENRREPRRPAAWPLNWVRLPDKSHVFQARTKDLSTRGVLAVLDQNLPANTRLLIQLVVPPSENGGRHPIVCEARVAHCTYSSTVQAFLVGLEFLDLPPAGQNILIQHISGLPIDGPKPKGKPDSDAGYLA